MKRHEVDQGTDEWFKLRYGLPTASYASSLIQISGEPSKSMKGYAEKLAGDRFAGKPLDGFKGNSSTQRGNELEPEARTYYAYTKDIEVEECGFFTDSMERYGASPDGLVGSDGLLEIKCQEPAGHIKTALMYQRTGKTPSAYIQQIQMQMLVCERAWVDLVLYHPDLPCSIIRVYRDEKVISALKTQITACILYRDEVLSQLQNM